MKLLYPFITLLFLASSLHAADTPDLKLKPSGFVENCGQIMNQYNLENKDVNFIWATGKGLNVQLRNSGISFDTYHKNGEQVSFHRLDMEFVGMNSHATPLGTNPLPHAQNFYSSHTNSAYSGVRSFEGVTYTSMYENIDFEVSVTEKGQLKYDFILNSPTQTKFIKIKYAGFDNFEMIDGNLVFDLSGRKITETIPA